MAGSFAVSSLVVAVYRSSGPLAAGLKSGGVLLSFLRHFSVFFRGDATPACMPVEFVAQWLPRFALEGTLGPEDVRATVSPRYLRVAGRNFRRQVVLLLISVSFF